MSLVLSLRNLAFLPTANGVPHHTMSVKLRLGIPIANNAPEANRH